ncbi:MAG: aminotransferase class V-fold PLP-dependent enzyme, partial [Pseudomonadota bacterium]
MSVYLDNAASTRPAPEVLDAMTQVAGQLFANPSSAHAAGAAAARELDRARHELAAALGSAASELVFTGGGTEANALAVLGACARARARGGAKHAVVTAIEHPAVLANVERLARQGDFTVTSVAVGPTGIADAAAVIAAIRPETVLVAVMLVNNELGTVQ